MRSSWKTKNGTELQLLNLRGKEYLQVAQRIVWMREEHPEWCIETILIRTTENQSLAQAIIRNERGVMIAMAHKFEDQQGFADFIEKSETGAIGRALALCGYGTQFCADEFDEGARLADSPIEKKKPEPFTAPKVVMQTITHLAGPVERAKLASLGTQKKLSVKFIAAELARLFPGVTKVEELTLKQFDELYSTIERTETVRAISQPITDAQTNLKGTSHGS